MRNRMKAIVESKGITPYRLWKDLGCSREVAYRLVNNPSYIPREIVLEAICRTYGLQPGDILEYIPDQEVADNRDAAKGGLPLRARTSQCEVHND